MRHQRGGMFLDTTSRLPGRSKGEHLCRMGKRHPAHPACAADGMREDDRLCKSDGGLRAAGGPRPDPGTPRGAAGAGCGQDRQVNGAGMCDGESRCDLHRELVQGHGRVGTVHDEGCQAWKI